MHSVLRDQVVRRFLGGAGIALFLRVAWAIASYASVFFLARWLTNDDYGLFAVIISTVTLLSVFCGLGAQTTLIRFLGQYDSEGRPPLAKGAIRFFEGRVGRTVLGVGGLGILGSWVLFSLGLNDSPWAFTLGFLLLPAYAMIDVQGGVGRAYGAVVSSLAPRDVVWRVLLVCFGLAATLYLPVDRQLIALLVAAVVSLYLLVLLQRVAVRRRIPPEVRDSVREGETALWTQVSTPIWLAASAGALLKQFDVIVVGALFSKADAGFYFAASRTAALVAFVLMATNLIIGPAISRLYHAGDTEGLKRLLRAGATLVFLPSAAVFAACLAFGDRILQLFGAGFASAHTVLVILAAAQMVNASTGCVGIVLNMIGHQKEAARIQIIGGLVGVAAMVGGAMALGPVGAAIGSAVGLAFWNVWMWWFTRGIVGFDPSILGLLRR